MHDPFPPYSSPYHSPYCTEGGAGRPASQVDALGAALTDACVGRDRTEGLGGAEASLVDFERMYHDRGCRPSVSECTVGTRVGEQ